MPGTTDSESKNNETRTPESKPGLPYPSFSKAHSKETLGSRDSVRPSLNIFTPPPTDVNASKEKIAHSKSTAVRNAPPSPPLTDQNLSTPRGSIGKPPDVDTIPEEDKKNTSEKTPEVGHHVDSGEEAAGGGGSSRAGLREDGLKSKPQDRSSTNNVSQTPPPSTSQSVRLSSTQSAAPTTEAVTNLSSNATSIAPDQPGLQRPASKSHSTVLQHAAASQVTSLQDSSPHVQAPLEIFIEDERPSSYAFSQQQCAPPPPPPPPPPPDVPTNVPKVDYLLQYGGLNQVVTKNLLLAGKPMVIQQVAQSPGQPPPVVANLFEPYTALLDDFQKVISKNGSLAVATGYRSVARRLLDRLEAVFARDISSETCQCCMCSQAQPESEDRRGVSWGEVLELVSGRRDLPNWPPYSFVQSPTGLGINLDAITPMQELDSDIPEEYREHYIRQSRKTKQSVDRWLHRQNIGPTSLPEEADDETLTFAILTYLPAEQRPMLTNLLGIIQGPVGPPRRAPSPEREAPNRTSSVPAPRVRPKPIEIASLAIQRLYRLGQPPRDPETAIFMLNNHSLHNALATLAEISNDEWDILISGRFDGFLRSGADELPDMTSSRTQPYKSISRGPTPARMNGHLRQSSNPSRGPTPANHLAQYGAPVTFDEETEIATLAEIERDIYIGMEALEDAFEALHQKAEAVRKALRDRSAGLAAAAQRRRGSLYGPEVRGGTPGIMSGSLNGERWDAETDDGLGDWDGISELAPDDSASNISSSRRRRPKRRHERRTPVVVLEEDESEDLAESEGTASPKKREK